jgi:hypothetical protein
MIKDLLGTSNVTALKHPAHSADLTVADLYLIFTLKSALKGRRFSDATDITMNAKEELKRLEQNGFQKCCQHILCIWQK